MNEGMKRDRLTLKRAWRPFSAACSSRRFFSSGDKFPAFSAAWIWSKTLFSSIAERSVDTLFGDKDRCTRIVPGHLRLTEHVILSLHIVQPTTDSEECLASG